MNGHKWVYVNESVAFDHDFHSAAHKAALGAGYDDDRAKALSNLALVGALDPHIDMAMGTIRQGRPQIYVTNVDRNWTYDVVAQALAREA